jgi:hypothetical protein
MRHNAHLIRLFTIASEGLREHKAEAERRINQVVRAEHESEANEEIGLEMSQAQQEKYPTVFAKVLAKLWGYLGEDVAEPATTLVSKVGPPYGHEERESLQARPESRDRGPPSGAFMHAPSR